ncbi:MAG: relaxase/mobilization nuclease domain-containing protein [Cyanobacteria bacterium]|nr:relaxase/mobilization nuclease domain-containing protein [Cyanobacteriota bacterium]
MLAKQVKGRDFHGCLAYVLGKAGAIKIGGNVRGRDPLALSHEFLQPIHDRSHLTRLVYHCALSLPPGESLEDWTWRKITKDYLEAMGFKYSQYILVRHTDTDHHQHVHIVANRVGMDGKTVSESFDHFRCQTVVRAIEEAYHLQPVTSSWESGRKALSLRQLNKEAETGKPSVQRILQETIADVVPVSLSLADLVERLQSQKIKSYGFYGRKGRFQGIAYEFDGVTMSGTALGHNYQVGRLLTQLETQGGSLEPWHSEQQVKNVRQGTIAAIQGAAFDQPSLSQLRDRLADEGIDLHVQFRKLGRFGTGPKAIQYRTGEICFHGSDLGTAYTLQGLQNKLGISFDDFQQRSQVMEVRVVSRAIDDALQDSVLERLTQLLRQFSEEAKQKQEKLEVYSNLEPGLNHLLALAALYLKTEEERPIVLVIGATDNATIPQAQTILEQADRILQGNTKNRPNAEKVWIDYGDEPNLNLDPKQRVLWIKPQIVNSSNNQNLQQFDRT